MGLFSKPDKSSAEESSAPEAPAPELVEPPFAMNQEQYEALIKKLDRVLKNQVIGDNKLDQLQQDLNTAIRNQQIIGNDQDALIKKVADIEGEVEDVKEDTDEIKRLLNKR